MGNRPRRHGYKYMERSHPLQTPRLRFSTDSTVSILFYSLSHSVHLGTESKGGVSSLPPASDETSVFPHPLYVAIRA